MASLSFLFGYVQHVRVHFGLERGSAPSGYVFARHSGAVKGPAVFYKGLNGSVLKEVGTLSLPRVPLWTG